MLRRNADLLAIGASVAVSLWIFAFVDQPYVRAAPALAMVLFLPGYAVSLWLFPSPRLERLERLLLAIGISLSVAVVGALVLDRTTARLTARSWAAELAAVVAVAVAGAAWRRRGSTVPGGGRRPLRMTLGRLLVVSLAAAAAAASVVVAIVVARLPAGPAHGSTILWASTGSRAHGTYALGLESHELRTSRYVLTGAVDGSIVLRRAFTVPTGGVWHMAGSVGSSPVSRILEISLYKASAPSVVYRHVTLTFGTSGA